MNKIIKEKKRVIIFFFREIPDQNYTITWQNTDYDLLINNTVFINWNKKFFFIDWSNHVKKHLSAGSFFYRRDTVHTPHIFSFSL